MELKALGSYIGICKQSEVLVLSTIGIFCTIFDASLLNLWPDLHRIWTVLMDPIKMPIVMHLYIRYLLSGVVIAQAFTLHIYLASYVVLMYPVCTMERPQLILPWLLIGTVKTILLCTLTFTTGLYVCSMYRFMRPACWDFLLTQLVTHGPSFYMWGLILSYYRDLKKIEKLTSDIEIKSICTADISTRRKKAKSLARSSHGPILYEDNRTFLSASTIENTVHHLKWVGNRNTIMSRSLDTLVSDMEMEADRQLLLGSEIEESFVPDDRMTVEEKTVQLLQVSPMEIIRGKRERKFLRQIASTSTMTVKSSLTFRSIIDITYALRVLSDNVINNEDNASALVTTEKSSCESETEIRVIELNSPDCLTNKIVETESRETLSEPLEIKMIKKIEVMFNGAGAAKSSKGKKHLIKYKPIMDTSEIQVPKRRSYQHDGYTEAYICKKQYDEETAKKEQLRNFK